VRMTYVIHIAAGSLSLVVGYVALYSAKGGALHRRAGMLFVYAMIAMCAFGAMIAATRSVAPALNVPVAILTSYLVATALLTVRPAVRSSYWLDVASMLVGLGAGLTFLTFGFEAIASGGTRNGMPAFPFLMFGVVGVLAGAGDLRVIRSGALRGPPRLARHLWRMSFALFTASLSFFIGQAKVIPEPIRIRPLLALPVLAVLVTMLYWLWRVRSRRSLRCVVRLTVPEAA
jgi:uncharacterized membrane protein